MIKIKALNSLFYILGNKTILTSVCSQKHNLKLRIHLILFYTLLVEKVENTVLTL